MRAGGRQTDSGYPSSRSIRQRRWDAHSPLGHSDLRFKALIAQTYPVFRLESTAASTKPAPVKTTCAMERFPLWMSAEKPNLSECLNDLHFPMHVAGSLMCPISACDFGLWTMIRASLIGTILSTTVAQSYRGAAAAIQVAPRSIHRF
jgi:hypothetical protein